MQKKWQLDRSFPGYFIFKLLQLFLLLFLRFLLLFVGFIVVLAAASYVVFCYC